jgi:thioredoxin-like negative regulator of GroEL
MIERFLITLIIGVLAVTAYLLLVAYQRRRATVANQSIAAPGHVRVLYFRSETCGACRAQTQALSQLDDPQQALIELVDIDQAPELARQYNIMTLPTTILIDRAGAVRHINPGVATSSGLTRQLEELMKS